MRATMMAMVLAVAAFQGGARAAGALPLAGTVGADVEIAEDGAYCLDSEADYAWFLAECPGGATVRLTGDIMLLPKRYTAWYATGDTLTFDGQGHTITLPEGATMDGDGSTTGRDYAGIVAGRLSRGTVRDVDIVVGGRIVARPYAGAVLGSGMYSGGGEVVIENVGVYLLSTGAIEAEGNNTNGHAGALVGRGYSNDVTLRDCLIVCEAGSRITNLDNRGAGPERPSQTAVTCGDIETESGIMVLDFGVSLPEGSPYSRDVDGDTAVFKGTNVPTEYTVVPGGSVADTFLIGDIGEDADGVFSLAGTRLTVGAVTVPAGWETTVTGNVLALSGPGGTVSLAYTFKGIPNVSVPLTVTLPWKPTYGFALAGNVSLPAATQSRLETYAIQSGLAPDPAIRVLFKTSGKPTLEALDCFDNILVADTANQTITVDYDLNVTDIAVSADRATVTATIELRGPARAAFAKGTQIVLRDAQTGKALSVPVLVEGRANAKVSIPAKPGTCLFRASVEKR